MFLQRGLFRFLGRSRKFCRLDWVVQVRHDDRFGLFVSGCFREFHEVLLLLVVFKQVDAVLCCCFW